MNLKKFVKDYLSKKDIRQFHTVSKRPWPILTSLLILTTVVNLLNNYLVKNLPNAVHFPKLSVALVLLSTFIWWRDVTRESNSGQHTVHTTDSIRIAIIVFIASEVLFFFGFFWAFFWYSWTPTIKTGIVWPPTDIIAIRPYGQPLLNTAILLTSGVTVTWSHKIIYQNRHKRSLWAIKHTIVLALIFIYIQYHEFNIRFYDISDSVYSSIFFVATGFHGLHVMIGSIFIIVSASRTIKGQLNRNHHVNTELAIWYWHFVDVVWLFLFVWVYWWSYR